MPIPTHDVIIRRWRESSPRPLTREKLANLIGRCQSTIRNWENGREPRLTDLRDMEGAKPGLLCRLFPAVFAKVKADKCKHCGKAP